MNRRDSLRAMLGVLAAPFGAKAITTAPTEKPPLESFQAMERLSDRLFGPLPAQYTFPPPGYKPLPAQARFHASNATSKIMVGEFGSGRSTAVIQEAIRLSCTSPGSIGYLLGSTHNGGLSQCLMSALDAAGIRYNYHSGDNQYVEILQAVRGGLPSQIILRSGNSDPDHLRGPNIDWFGMDDMHYQNHEVWKMLEGRLRCIRGPRLKFGSMSTRLESSMRAHSGWGPIIQASTLITSIPKPNLHLPTGFFAGAQPS